MHFETSMSFATSVCRSAGGSIRLAERRMRSASPNFGGMGSVGGAALAAFLVGMLRVMSVAYLDSSFRDAFVFALLIAVLLVRPSGLFGRGRAVRA